MNGDVWTDEAIEALIRGLDGDDWRERAADINRDLLRWVEDGRITDERAERLNDAIQARHQRTTKAATDKVELRKRDGHAIGGAVGRIVMPMVDRMRPAPPAPSPAPVITRNVGVRGPSQETPAERAARADRRWQQAHMTAAPAEVLRGLRAAACAVLAIIVLDCRSTAEATCERSMARIAGAAGCKERTAQKAVRQLVGLGLVAVEDRPGTTNRITVTSEEIDGWRRRAERFRDTLSEEKKESKEENIKAPPRGAFLDGMSGEKSDESGKEAPPPAPARAGADRRPLPSLGNVARLRVKTEVESGPTPLEALIARVLPEVEAEDARRQAQRPPSAL
ncbi:hypothetical protein ACIQW5_10415 [Methylorubrum thiocyanatum]|uniref:hypothetical protein n=1 Tax=Methylorubrum thiocyanatum TaxID=47958 RepID=UPI00383A79F2